MPKTMPGLNKIRRALALTEWFGKIEPNRVIVVAGTNGKGSTCAALEALLVSAGLRTGFYSSPHLVSTTERIRKNKIPISEEEFVRVFNECAAIIKSCELSHFEALTFMAGQFYFNRKTSEALDFVILEVGLGGAFDATNAFPHKYNIITALGMDHTSILGGTLKEVAANKFGIIGKKNIVVHQKLSPELHELKASVKKETNSNWIEVDQGKLRIDATGSSARYFVTYMENEFEINLAGRRAMENIMNAITMFQVLGFDFNQNRAALKNISWQGRMQKVQWLDLKCPIYLSGDHNEQGIQSLVEILKDFSWRELHLVVGIGTDKASTEMLRALVKLPAVKLYLTETPFKGLKMGDYPAEFSDIAESRNSEVQEILFEISEHAAPEDLCVVTGSLYLVGKVLSLMPVNQPGKSDLLKRE